MCGLIATISKSGFGFLQQDLTKFNQMLVCDSVRGPDSTGVFGVNTQGNADWLKTKGNPFNLIESNEYKEFATKFINKYQMVVGHNRKATVGNITDETAHPFQEGNIILVHNGTLNEHKSLTENEVTVDSHAITHAIAEKGYREALKEINGAFALIWYDAADKCLRFVRNTQRPLYILESESRYWLASEWEMVSWIVARENWSTGAKFEYREVTPGIVHSIKLGDAKEITEEEVEFYSPPKVEQQVIKHTFSRWNEQSKKPLPQTTTGSRDYSVRAGDHLAIHVETVIEWTSKTQSPFVAHLKGQRVVPDPTPVYVRVTQDEMDWYLESGENTLWVTVDRVLKDEKTGEPMRIYAYNPDEYENHYDVTGEEVYLEEWKAVESHRCKKCSSFAFWKDIKETFFKFKSPTKHRIICKDCWEKQRKGVC